MSKEIPDFDEERYGFPVPEMPPVDNKMEPGTHKGNWLWVHYDSTNHNYKNEDTLEPQPAPLTDVVTPENPLQVDVFYSMRSPYSYLVLQKVTWLNSNYNVDVNLKVIFPVAVRTPGMFSGGTGGTEEGHAKGGRWYKWADHAATEETLDCMVAQIFEDQGDRLMPRLIRYVPERKKNLQRWTDGLTKFSAPESVFWGTEDPIAVEAMADKIKELRPATDLHKWPDVSHWPSIEVPDRVATVILGRLE